VSWFRSDKSVRAPAAPASLAHTRAPAATLPPLDRVLLAYAPMIDVQRRIVALRLTLAPRPQGPRPQAGALLAALAEAWPPDAGRLCLNVTDEALLLGLVQALGAWPADEPMPLALLELPAFALADDGLCATLAGLHARGLSLLLVGVPRTPLAPALLACFSHALVDLAEERRQAPALDEPSDAAAEARRIAVVQSGVRTQAQLAAAFARGAVAALGWPVDDVAAPVPSQAPAVPPGMAAALELIGRVDREEPLPRLEGVLATDPALAWRLLRYVNSPHVGLRVPVESFAQALQLLGYQGLRRWLILLLMRAQPDVAGRPLACAALRRALLMEALGRACGLGDALVEQLFVTGVFSLLDRLLQQPMDWLLQAVPTPPALREALLAQAGPLQPLLALARALEAGVPHDIEAALEAAMLDAGTVNRALLQALVAAQTLE
jgi:EAL and modified HD-GYP domain-containing signal transduction protein